MAPHTIKSQMKSIYRRLDASGPHPAPTNPTPPITIHPRELLVLPLVVVLELVQDTMSHPVAGLDH